MAKIQTDVPIMPLSTGTNNVFPYMIEAIIAAEAVAAIVMDVISEEEGTRRRKRLDILLDGELKDTALIDVAVTTYSFVGSKAIWEPEYFKRKLL